MPFEMFRKHSDENHKCNIKHTSEEYMSMHFPKDWSTRMKNYYLHVILISEKNRRSRTFFRSNASIYFEKRRHLHSKYRYIIHPFSLFRLFWETFIAIVFAMTLIMVPINVIQNMISVFTTRKPVATFLVLWSDTLCTIHMIINCFTGYPNYVTKEVYLEPMKILKYYYSNGDLIMDILTALPYHGARHLWFMSRQAKLYVVIYTLIKGYRLKPLVIYSKNFSMNWSINTILFKLLLYLLVCCVVLHWATCLLIIVPYFIKINDNFSLSWIDHDKFYTSTFTTHYKASSFLAAASFLCMPSTEPIESLSDTIMFSCIYCIGYVLCILLFVIILQIVLSYNAPSTKYESIMSQLSQYMRHRQLPINLQSRLVQYYGHRFHRTYFNEGAIMSILSDRLQLEINLHCYTTLVQNVTILHELPENIVNEVVSSLKAEVFLPNDIIIKAGTIGDSMYFISCGTVSVSTPTGREVCHLQDGAYFGEVALVRKDQKRIANVVAIEICEVYKLDRKVFKSCLAKYPNVFKRLEKIAQDRYNRTNFLEELHKKHILEKTLARKHDLNEQ